MRHADLLWRAGLVVGALGCALLGGPALTTGVLALLALVCVVQRLARQRALGALDAGLVLGGGVLVTLVLVGLVLGLTPGGLDRTGWSVGVAVAAALGLLVSALLPRPAAHGVSHGVSHGGAWAVARSAPWAVVAVAAVVVAVTVSARSMDDADRSPLQMSFGQVRGNDVQVVVSASARTGPLELRTQLGGTQVSYPLFTVRPGTSTTQSLTLPATGRYRITVNYVDQPQPLRTLILDR